MHLDDALDGLAMNPALPRDLARRLIGHHRGRHEVARRGDLDCDLIEQMMATDCLWLLHSLALNKSLSPAVQLRLTAHSDGSIRAALVVQRHNGPRELYERLIADEDKRVREYLAQSDHVPDDLRARLANDPDPEIRATLARWWPQAPEAVRRILLTDPQDSVRAAACSTYYARLPHPIPPADLIPALLADPVTREGVLRHTSLDRQTAQRLAADPDHRVRRQLAEHPDLPADLRDAMATDPSSYVRLGIFSRPDTPEPTRERLYREITAPSDLLDEDRIEDFISDLEIRMLQLAWVTADPLPHVDSPYPCFRASAAANDSLPPDVVTRLLNDEDSSVRTTMYNHAKHLVDEATAERIDRDFRPVKKTIWRPADDFTFAAETLRRLATDPDPRMRELAPRDPDLPAELVRSLALDQDYRVREAVASHPNLPLSTLVGLLADEAGSVARAAAASPCLPRHEMDRLLQLAQL